MDQELRTFLQEQFQEIRQRFEKAEGQIADLREESREGLRHTHALLEAVEGNVRLLAEGVASVTERMDRLEHELGKKLDEQWGTIVNPVRDLHHRVAHLEEVENRRTRDIVEVIRERFGKRQDS